MIEPIVIMSPYTLAVAKYLLVNALVGKGIRIMVNNSNKIHTVRKVKEER